MEQQRAPVTFERLGERDGLAVIDRLEQQRYRIHTPAPVAPESIPTEGFRFPVGRAVRFSTPALVLPNVVGVAVRDANGDVVAEANHLDTVSLPPGAYCLELSTQIKTYVEVDSAIELSVDMSAVRIGFDTETTVSLGARSRHDRPAGTVTTTADPVDLMAAIETFGSALKTTAPERSYPTLRGHPPAIELSEELAIPSGVEPPETGITLELPPEYRYVFVAAPLAYYLGASIEPGPTPRLTTDRGFEYPLSTYEGYETAVAETLKQVFFLDCVTRTEGTLGYDLHERRAVDRYLDLDFAALYDQPIAAQVEQYLEVPFEVVADLIPDWRLTTHVELTPEHVEQLPFVVDDLAIVKAPPNSPGTESNRTPSVSDLSRDDVITRSAGGAMATERPSYVQPQSSDTLEQAWIGDSIPIGASKLTAEAFRNRLERDTRPEAIEITIVLNDDRMTLEEDLVNEAYGDRSALPFDVTVQRDTSVAELRTLLETGSGFLHYIGHTERDGFECADGKLDAATLDGTAIDAFVLNACNSYNQGLHLIEAGAIGGIVTLNEIINDGAVRMGESVARLLNAGFPLRASLTIARDESVQGGQYIVVGDGGMTVTQAASRTPNLLSIDAAPEGYAVEITTYATDDAGLGSIYMPFFEDNDEYYLNSGSIDTFTVDAESLGDFLDLENVPVHIDGELHWSYAIERDDLP